MCTYRLRKTLGQVGKVKIGRTLITFSLKSGIETLLCAAHLGLVSTITFGGEYHALSQNPLHIQGCRSHESPSPNCAHR